MGRNYLQLNTTELKTKYTLRNLNYCHLIASYLTFLWWSCGNLCWHEQKAFINNTRNELFYFFSKAKGALLYAEMLLMCRVCLWKCNSHTWIFHIFLCNFPFSYLSKSILFVVSCMWNFIYLLTSLLYNGTWHQLKRKDKTHIVSFKCIPSCLSKDMLCSSSLLGLFEMFKTVFINFRE